MSEFKWDKCKVISLEVTDEEKDELLKLIKEVNKKGCDMYQRMEDEYINKAMLYYYSDGDWQKFFEILVSNGYEVTVKMADDDRVEITWKDKNDLVEEIKREARKIEAER